MGGSPYPSDDQAWRCEASSVVGGGAWVSGSCSVSLAGMALVDCMANDNARYDSHNLYNEGYCWEGKLGAVKSQPGRSEDWTERVGHGSMWSLSG